MCGIAGIWRRQGDVREEEVAMMLATMKHRGPDDEGRFVDRDLALGMRRLAIQDVAGGHQPYRSESGQIVAIFNGEIYNYPELAHRVQAHGHRLTSRTDGEVLVHLYEMDGPDFVKRLRGMFAIALWDRTQKRLLLARDHLGQKPLYLFESGNTLSFASELKAFYCLPDFSGAYDPSFLSTYLAHRFVPAPDTLVRGVKKLLPGEVVIFENQGPAKRWTYWQPEIAAAARTESFEDLADELDELLKETVTAHLASDVPLGIFLSGGLDSSLLAALASLPSSVPMQAWVAHFPRRHPNYNETEWAAEVARRFHLNLRTVDVEWSLSPERLRELAYVLDEPMADPTVLPLDGVARAASEEQTVMLSGEGADEIFAGYQGYGEPSSLRSLRRMPATLRRFWRDQGWPGSGAVGRSLVPMAARYRGVGFTFDGIQQEKLLRPEYRMPDRPQAVARYWGEVSMLPELQAMQGFDVRWFLADDVLHKADRIGMHHHLEIRVPYCDYRIVEFAMALSPQFRRTDKVDKRILRYVASRHLPSAIVSRPKQGFPTPLTDLLNGPLGPWVREILTDPSSEIRHWLLPDQVTALISQIAPGKPAISRQVYAVAMLELWAQEMKARRIPLAPHRSRTRSVAFRSDSKSQGVPVGPVD